MIEKQKKRRFELGLGVFLNTGLAIVFVSAAVFFIHQVNVHERERAVAEAEVKAKLILDRNLATHTYFTHTLKPKVFEFTQPFRSKDYFEPAWMSSTYAVREIEKIFNSMDNGDYYYKECAINARSPQNEADEFEKAFIEELNTDPKLVYRSLIRNLDGAYYFVILRRGEVMEATCLRCHSDPANAPKDLVAAYDAERSFNRKVNEVVSAISIRVPISAAYAKADQFSQQLSTVFIIVLMTLFAVQYIIYRFIVIKPIINLKNKAQSISKDDTLLGEEIPLPISKEFSELARTFNAMSRRLRSQFGHLEDMVEERTAELRLEFEERRKLDKELQKKEEVLSAILNNIEDGIVACNHEGVLTVFNRATEKFHGLPHEHLPADEWTRHYDLYNKDGKTPMEMDAIPLVRALHGEHIHNIEMVIAPKKGKQRRLLASGQPLVDSQGSKLGAVVSMHDITEQRKIELSLRNAHEELEKKVEKRTIELRKSKEEWEKTFDAMNDIITIQDKDFRIVKANKMAYQTFQIEPGEFNGKYCYEVFRGSKQPCQGCPVLESLKNEDTHATEIVHENLGKIFHVTSSPILNEKGQFTHLLHIAKDITEQKKMEKELLHAHKMEAIGTLAGGIAHDFNNILTPILGYADMILEKLPEGSQLREDQQQVLIAGNRAKDLVKQILTFSRQSKKELLLIQPDIIIKEALKFLRASLPTFIEINTSIQKCGMIHADPTQLHQIIMNLCTNAYHAMRESGGVLRVTLAPVTIEKGDLRVENLDLIPGTYLILEVSDTGHGMHKKTVEMIFDPYFTTKKEGEGTGMGLSVVHGIVKSYGGHVFVYSELEKGTTFKIYLPCIVSEETSRQSKIVSSYPGGAEKVLIVDDEDVIVQMERQMLESLGYKVTALTSSKEAWDVLQKQPASFDLVITDMTMPNITGIELAQRYLSLRPDASIILCTGFSELINGESSKDLGIRGFIMKPVLKKDLATAVRKALDEQES